MTVHVVDNFFQVRGSVYGLLNGWSAFNLEVQREADYHIESSSLVARATTECAAHGVMPIDSCLKRRTFNILHQ